MVGLAGPQSPTTRAGRASRPRHPPLVIVLTGSYHRRVEDLGRRAEEASALHPTVTVDDVARIALDLPEVTEGLRHGMAGSDPDASVRAARQAYGGPIEVARPGLVIFLA